jgi:hypothetical protein
MRTKPDLSVYTQWGPLTNKKNHALILIFHIFNLTFTCEEAAAKILSGLKK